ncbi:hypothetical protein QYE76_054001 [Lolium multiflorum]|uniref:Transposase (putative) gypsy type domain-containing protein n=2 Tax=Lolium TaxID=4520 RepID=A0AAD8WKD8_LOLMU|nr:hypothetical protein QYE76_054001 [Lolium multiflorum]
MPRGRPPATCYFFFLALLPHRYPPRARARCCSANIFRGELAGDSTDPPPPPRQSGATGPRVSTERPQPPLSPPRSQGSSSPFSLSWSSSSSTSSMASPSGSWRGSYMREDDIERLVRLRRVPRSVITRVPGEEVEPEPRPGERVVFGAHLDRGLGLPASPFFRQFLDHFGLQPHHLPANACVLLSCFVAFMEAYAGLWPDIDFWSRLFFLKAQTNDGRLRACGAASIYTRPGTPFPKIPTVDSVKNWQMSFFYVRNEGELVDRINLPEFNPAPPVGRINWSHNARSTDPDAEVNLLWDLLATATAGGLTAEDLLCTIAERRVLPLQMRTHKIGHMSGRFDPNRTSKVPLTKAQVASRVNHITKANLAEAGLRAGACDGNHPPAGGPGELIRPFTRAPGGGGASDVGTGPIPAVPLRHEAAKRHGDRRPEATKKAGSTAARSRGRKKRAPASEEGPEQAVCPGRRLPASSARCVAASAPEEGADAAAFLARTYAAAACDRGFFLCRAAGLTPDRGTRVEPTRQPTLDDMFPRRTPLLDPAAGAGGACRLQPGPEPAGLLLGRRWQGRAAAAGAAEPTWWSWTSRPQAPETTGPAGPSAAPGATPPPQPTRDEPTRQEPARDEPARTEGADSRALVRTAHGPAEGHANSCEVLSREGQPGTAPMKMLFSGYRASLKTKAAETLAAGDDAEDAESGLPGDAGRGFGSRWRRSRRRETGEGSSEYFSMEDHLASMAARIEPVTKLGWELRKAAEELVPMLWPGEAAPQDISGLISSMERAPDRFLDWKESATRAGADMALSFVLSWYNEVDLGQLEFRRAGVEDKLPAELKAARLARASTIAGFVDKALFVADPNPPPSDEEYMDDEEAEDVPEDDPAAGSADAPPA